MARHDLDGRYDHAGSVCCERPEIVEISAECYSVGFSHGDDHRVNCCDR